MRSRLIVSLIFGAFFATSALSEGRPADVESHNFAAGQVWTFRQDSNEPDATLTILRVETLEKLGAIAHISISAVRTPAGVTTVLHLALSRDALDRSVVKQVRTETAPLDLRGYEAWRAGDGGIITTSVDQAIEHIRQWSPVADDAPCAFDREHLLALNEHEFDQDMEGGWRRVAARDKCLSIAADLIRDYRELHKLESPILFWHEGQLRAEMGQTDAAIRLFQLSRKPADSVTGWNEYVDASVAFLRNDRPAFDKARAALAVLPRPTDWNWHKPGGELVAWPMNLEVVDQLGRCFGLTYRKAYGRCKK